MKILQWAFMAAAIALTATACNDDDDNTIVDDYTLNISGPSEGNFFVDGKSWVAAGKNPDDSTNPRWVKFTVEGDTLVGGVKAKKIRSELVETGEKSPDCRVGYERNGVVYVWVNGAFRPLFDFNINVGDKIFTRFLDGQVSTTGYLLCDFEFSIQTEERKFKAYHLINGYTSVAEGGVIPNALYRWIESIGAHFNSIEGRFITLMPYDSEKKFNKFWDYNGVYEVYQDDKLIFSYYDLSEGIYPIE